MKINFKFILIILIISLFFIIEKNIEGAEGAEEDTYDIKYFQILGGAFVGLMIGLIILIVYYNTLSYDDCPEIKCPEIKCPECPQSKVRTPMEIAADDDWNASIQRTVDDGHLVPW